MGLIEALTPKHTEEVRPGCFIQKRKKGYKQIHPIAWEGKIDWGKQIRGILNVRTLFTIAVILFIYFSYLHDYRELKSFYETTMSDPQLFCLKVATQNIDGSNTIEMAGGSEVYAKKESDTNTLSNYP